MSGHRWSNFLIFTLTVTLTGCQMPGSGTPAWSPFGGKENATISDPNSSFSLPDFPQRERHSTSANGASATPLIASEQLERLLEKGQIALQENRLEDARQAYADVLSCSPDNATAHHGMAMAADLSGKFDDAEYHYRQALRIRPRDANLLCDIGYSYLLQNRYSEASRYLNHAIEINPQHESAQMNLALLDLREGNRTGAEQRIQQRFGITGKTQQILAQLEMQATEASGQTFASVQPVSVGSAGIQENATLEQIRELARRERVEAERQRALKDRAQTPQPISATSDAANNNPAFNANSAHQSAVNAPILTIPPTEPIRQPPGHLLSAATPGLGSNTQASAEQRTDGLVRSPEPWVASTTMTDMASVQSQGPAPNSVVTAPSIMPPSTMPVGNPASAAILQGIQGNYPTQMLSTVPHGTTTIPQGITDGNLGSVSADSRSNANVGQSHTAASIPGINAQITNQPPQMPSATSLPAPPAGPVRNSGQMISVYSSGAFQPPPSNPISYGQPINSGTPAGFALSPRMPNNTAALSVHGANLPNGIPGASGIPPNGAAGQGVPANNAAVAANGGNYQTASAAGQISVEGLNIGPGSLFPVGQMNAQTGLPIQHGSTGNPPALGMGNISSPGTNSMINGSMYGQPARILPAQELMNSQPGQQGYQQPGLAGPGTPWPGGSSAATAPANPLETYERQLQQLDNEYNKTLQQLNRRN